MYSLNKIPANVKLQLVSKIDMVIQIVNLSKCFEPLMGY